jgi:hypothetical protein
MVKKTKDWLANIIIYNTSLLFTTKSFKNVNCSELIAFNFYK